MAPARDRNGNPYEDPGGYGKYRKSSVRNQPYSPYQRPPTAVRNPSLAPTTGHANGWLSKLVDPAQRLITSGAHKLFASVFRKRLPPPPPPQPPESETNVEASSSQEEAVLRDSHGIPEPAVKGIASPASSSDRDGLTELELMLKQKTFTKSEIARLTDLLQSRTVDSPVCIQQKNSEVIPSKPVFSHERKEVAITPIKDGRLERNVISTPIASSSVLDEDVATPAELAKAYMGSRPSEVSPPVLGLRGRAIGEDSVAQFNQQFPSKSPILSVVPRPSVRSLANENGFVTPRSRGRSAIYSMARTPYSRLRSASTLEGTRSEIVGAPPPSSSQSMWENGFSGSKQGSLKRRISVFDSDIGSVGPIRRIRQKSNLLPSSGTLSIRGTGVVSDAARRPSSSQKEPLLRETVTENGDTTAHASRTSSVPSKSSEVASQILQQLEVLVPPRDKSPSKMSPSKLRGPALRSLENVESSMFLEAGQDNKKLDIRPGGSLSDTQKPVSQKEDKVKGKAIVNPLTSNEKLASSSNGVYPANLLKKNPSDDKLPSPQLDSVAQTPQKKRAFQMSAHEDFLEVDDDDHADEIPSATLSTEKAAKVGVTVADKKNSIAEASVLEKAAVFSKVQNQPIPLFNQKAPGPSERTTVADKNNVVTVADASLSGVSSQEPFVDCQATVTSKKASPPKESNADAPIFNFAKKAVSTKDSNGFPTFGFNSKTPVAVSTSPVVTELKPTGTVFGASLDTKSDNSSSFAFTGHSTMKPLPKEPESDKADGKNNLKAGAFSSPTETASTAFPPSTTSIFSFTGTPANASITNGSIPNPLPSVSFPDTAKTGFGQSSMSNTSTATTTITATNSNPSVSTSTPSLVSSPVFQFGSSKPVSESAESEKKEASFTNNLSSSPFGTSGSLFSGTSSAIKSTGSSSSSNTFGISPPSSSAIFSFNSGGNTNQSQSVNPFGAPPTTQASSAASIFGTSSSTSSIFGTSSSTSSAFGTSSSTGSVFGTPNPFGSSSSTPSFGLTSTTPPPSGSSLFSSSAAFGLTSSTAAANTVSSATNSTLSTTFPTPTFGLTSANSVSSTTSSTLSSSTTFSTPTFGSAFGSSPSPSPGFVFGATSSAASSAAPSGPVFNFNSPATTTPTQSVFGSTNPNPNFMFGSSPGNNDQMAEDSMAEDTVQATNASSPVPVFGQQAVNPGFVFSGSTIPAGGNQNNPFQFGSQPSQQSQSPFQATGSLEFNAGGSFSLGTGDKSNRRFVKVKKNRKK